MCAACQPSTTTRATGAFTPSPTRARTAAAAALAGRAPTPTTTVAAAAEALRRRRDPRDQGPRRLPPRVPGRRRDRGGGAAGAQAPRGQAVCADGRQTWPPRIRWPRSARPRSSCSRALAAADRARAPAGPGAGGRVGRAGAARARVMLPYSPLHHLLLADAGVTLVMTSGNVSDEPIAYRDDDALRAARRHRRPLPRPRPPDPHAHRRLGGAGGRRRRPLLLRRSRGYVPASVDLPLAARAPRARRAAPSSRARSARALGTRRTCSSARPRRPARGAPPHAAAPALAGT